MHTSYTRSTSSYNPVFKVYVYWLLFSEIKREERLSESPLVLKTKEETRAPEFIEVVENTVRVYSLTNVIKEGRKCFI